MSQLPHFQCCGRVKVASYTKCKGEKHHHVFIFRISIWWFGKNRKMAAGWRCYRIRWYANKLRLANDVVIWINEGRQRIQPVMNAGTSQNVERILLNRNAESLLHHIVPRFPLRSFRNDELKASRRKIGLLAISHISVWLQIGLFLLQPPRALLLMPPRPPVPTRPWLSICVGARSVPSYMYRRRRMMRFLSSHSTYVSEKKFPDLFSEFRGNRFR